MASTKQAYPYSNEQDKRIDELMAELQKLQKREKVLATELRSLIYSVEKPR